MCFRVLRALHDLPIQFPKRNHLIQGLSGRVIINVIINVHKATNEMLVSVEIFFFLRFVFIRRVSDFFHYSGSWGF